MQENITVLLDIQIVWMTIKNVCVEMAIPVVTDHLRCQAWIWGGCIMQVILYNQLWINNKSIHLCRTRHLIVNNMLDIWNIKATCSNICCQEQATRIPWTIKYEFIFSLTNIFIDVTKHIFIQIKQCGKKTFNQLFHCSAIYHLNQYLSYDKTFVYIYINY